VRILVVEDEQKVASFIQRGLTAEQYSVDVAHDGVSALQQSLLEDYDLIILDVMIPQLDGFALLQQLRQKGKRTPVLMLTARTSVADKVQGLDLGADDYLTKPFAFDELLARIRALLRRGVSAASPLLQVADLTLDPASRQVSRAGRPIELTAREYALLEFFLRNRGRVLSRAQIAEHVWGLSFDTFTNIIDVYVNYLRRKIDSDFEPKLIHTVRGAGYVLKDPAP
jgi:heavy metal response regulator